MTKASLTDATTTECAVNDYHALREYLKKQKLPEFVLSFEQIEEIIDAALPRAAHRASWWETLRSPQEKMPQREACLAGGYIATRVADRKSVRVKRMEEELSLATSSPRRLIRQNPAAIRTSTRRAQWLPVPELTRAADIKLNKRVSLQRCSATISFADEAGAPSRYCLGGRVARLGCCLAVDPARLCRLDFQHRATVTFQLTILNVLNGPK